MNQDQDNHLSDVHINELELDKECIKLPTQYLRHAHAAVDSKLVLDQLKNELEVVEADLSKEVREHPAKFGIEKETEKAIAAVVLTHPRYQKALKRIALSKHEADLAQALVSAMEHKKRSLTLLVELHGLGYFSNPKITTRGKEAVEAYSKQRALRKAGYLKEED